MLIALWIINAVLALVFLASGLTKVTRTSDRLVAAGMGWTQDSPSIAVKLIGIAEILGALGLVLPLVTGIQIWLAPTSAAALVVLMGGAVATHVRRKERFQQPAILGMVAAASTVLGSLHIA